MADALITIPARRGIATHARAGQTITVINTHGTQVVDCWAFNAADNGEYMSMEASRAFFLKLCAGVGDSYLSNRRRKILTVLADDCGRHDTLIAPCDQQRYGLLGVAGQHDNCKDNLHAGLGALGVRVPYTPPSLNLFMNIPWTAGGVLAWGEPISAPGSRVVLRAEMDLIVAFSACPQDILPINGVTGKTTEAHFMISG